MERLNDETEYNDGHSCSKPAFPIGLTALMMPYSIVIINLTSHVYTFGYNSVYL